MEFYKVLTSFYSYPKKHEDITDNFLSFLEDNYPTIRERLNEFYADQCEWDSENPRMCLYGWDFIFKPGHFDLFLSGIKSIWTFLTDQNYGICFYCQKETCVDFEQRIIVSYEFGPVVKFYEQFGMDGSVQKEQLCCRSCATQLLQDLACKMNPEKETCWV